MKMADDYELIDSGGGRKFERFGRVTLVRPCSQALWRAENPAVWARASATFDRDEGNRWHGRTSVTRPKRSNLRPPPESINS